MILFSHCDHCGKATATHDLQRAQRASGCAIYLCPSCKPIGAFWPAEADGGGNEGVLRYGNAPTCVTPALHS